jgi:uncharacterized protein YecE (DUF72 family)
MGWSYNFWSGNFYPAELKPDEYLAEYSKYFSSVEVDNTFYRIPNKGTIMKWKNQVSKNFLFSLKFPRTITHVKMLENCEDTTSFFIERVSELQGNLGPLLLQFPPSFKSQKLHLLRDFLQALPSKYRFAVEVRNASLVGEELHSILRERGVALVIVGGSSSPRAEEMTADFVYLRWEGDRKKVNGTLGKVEIDRTEEIKKWAERIRVFLEAKKEVFGYFSKYYSGHPPTDAKKLLNLINEK